MLYFYSTDMLYFYSMRQDEDNMKLDMLHFLMLSIIVQHTNRQPRKYSMSSFML